MDASAHGGASCGMDWGAAAATVSTMSTTAAGASTSIGRMPGVPRLRVSQPATTSSTTAMPRPTMPAKSGSWPGLSRVAPRATSAPVRATSRVRPLSIASTAKADDRSSAAASLITRPRAQPRAATAVETSIAAVTMVMSNRLLTMAAATTGLAATIAVTIVRPRASTISATSAPRCASSPAPATVVDAAAGDAPGSSHFPASSLVGMGITVQRTRPPHRARGARRLPVIRRRYGERLRLRCGA